ncbi:MAG: OmpA family protein [Deltaproteobacteria bacterium]
MDRESKGSWLVKSVIAVGMSALGIACGPTYPNCDNDEQCHEGEFCVNGRCQDCRDDSQCPTGQMCEQYDCVPIPGWCNSDADCPADQMCTNNRCVPRPVEQAVVPTDPVPQICQLQPVYFAFDESALDDAARSALQGNVSCMQERDIQNVTVTVMCDPRGTEEYNMALGDRRARTTRDHLQRLGVQRTSLLTRSVGEEMAQGADEYGWSRDRRADVTERQASDAPARRRGRR